VGRDRDIVARRGMARLGRRGLARRGKARLGGAGLGRRGVARRGVVDEHREVDMNNIRFSCGDIVCLRHKTKSALGDSSYSFLDRYPMVIYKIFSDSDADNRMGEIGNSNVYFCKPCVEKDGSPKSIKLFQYEIVLWEEAKEEILAELRIYVKKLEECGDRKDKTFLKDKIFLPEWFKEQYKGITVEGMEAHAKQYYNTIMLYVNIIKEAGINPCYEGVDEGLK
jgi:hypothetical protein